MHLERRALNTRGGAARPSTAAECTVPFTVNARASGQQAGFASPGRREGWHWRAFARNQRDVARNARKRDVVKA